MNDITLHNLAEGLKAEILYEPIVISNIDRSFENSHDKILSSYKQNCPLITKAITHKNLYKPWINFENRRGTKRRERYFNLFQRKLISQSSYNSVRNPVISEIRTVKSCFYEKRSNNSKTNPKNGILSIARLN